MIGCVFFPTVWKNGKEGREEEMVFSRLVCWGGRAAVLFARLLAKFMIASLVPRRFLENVID